MRVIFLLPLFLWLIFACDPKNPLPHPEQPTTPKDESSVPECIQNKINSFKTPQQFGCKTGLSVTECELNGKRYYQFSHGHCGADIPTEWYDANCNYKCSKGGIAGQTGDLDFCDSLATEYFKVKKVLWSN